MFWKQFSLIILNTKYVIVCCLLGCVYVSPPLPLNKKSQMLKVKNFATSHYIYEVLSNCFDAGLYARKYSHDLRLGIIRFKIVPLCSDTALPLLLPLLICILEVFFLKHVKPLVQFALDLLQLHLWEEEDVTRGQIWQLVRCNRAIMLLYCETHVL